jgi:hypothetical protein
MTEDDWRLAGVILNVSDVTRASVRSTLEQSRAVSDRSRAEREAQRSIVVSETVTEAAIKRVAKRLSELLATHGEQTWNQLKHRFDARDRAHFADGVDRAVKAGQAVVEESNRGRKVKPC